MSLVKSKDEKEAEKHKRMPSTKEIIGLLQRPPLERDDEEIELISRFFSNK